MAAAEVSLDNLDQELTDMKQAFNDWTRRETKKSKEIAGKNSVTPCQPGEWILLTVDCSKKLKNDRAQWIYTPMAPGSPNATGKDDEDLVKQSIEEGLYAMKCLLRGFDPTGHTSADGFEGLKKFEYAKGGSPKAGKGVNSILIVSVCDQIMGVACNDTNKVTPKQRVQWARCKDSMQNSIGVKAACQTIFDSEDDFSAETVYKKAHGLTIVV